jgi:hypothetical protein
MLNSASPTAQKKEINNQVGVSKEMSSDILLGGLAMSASVAMEQSEDFNSSEQTSTHESDQILKIQLNNNNIGYENNVSLNPDNQFHNQNFSGSNNMLSSTSSANNSMASVAYLRSLDNSGILDDLDDSDDDGIPGIEGRNSSGNREIGDKRAGRRKIKIEYIEDKSRRHITFSKRKAGIMKKVIK